MKIQFQSYFCIDNLKAILFAFSYENDINDEQEVIQQHFENNVHMFIENLEKDYLKHKLKSSLSPTWIFLLENKYNQNLNILFHSLFDEHFYDLFVKINYRTKIHNTDILERYHTFIEIINNAKFKDNQLTDYATKCEQALIKKQSKSNF